MLVSPVEPGHSALSRKEWLALVLVTALAAAARLWNLTAKGLWFDELCTWKFASYPTLAETILEGSTKDYHPPGYVSFMHFWVKVFGDSEASLRMPSVIAGTLAATATFLLGRKLFSSRVGLIGAMFVATMLSSVNYSQEARSYSIMMLFGIVTTSLWVDLWRTLSAGARLPLKLGATLALSIAALSYSHYYGMLLAALQVLTFGLMCGIKRRGAWGVSAVVAFGLIMLPWAGGISSHLGRKGWIQWDGYPAALSSYGSFLFGGVPWLLILQIAIVFAAVVKWGVPGWRRLETHEGTAAVLLLAWMLIPFVLVVVRSATATPIYVHRYMMISLPAVALLIGLGLSRLRLNVAMVGVVAAGLIALTWWENERRFHMLSGSGQQAWRNLSQSISDAAKSDGPTAVIVITWKEGVENYYFSKFGGPKPIHVDMPEHLDAAWSKLLIERPKFLWVMTIDPGESWPLIGKSMQGAQLIGVQMDQKQVGRRALAYKFGIVDWKPLEAALASQ